MKRIALTIVLLSIAIFAFAQWQINENFEGGSIPTGWTVYDDGDGMAWRNLNNVSHAHSGTRSAFVDNYLPHQNHDWLITPHVNVTQDDSLIFYTRAWTGTENLKIYVSTAGNASSSFTHLLLNQQNIGITYQRLSVSLSSYIGQAIYIGFYWECNTYGILVDDVQIGHPFIIQPELSLPESYTFIQDNSLLVNFTPFITTTELSTAQLSVAGNTNVDVQITGLEVTFSAPSWHGTETLTFTLTDGSSGLQASDTIDIIVSPPPLIDLAAVQVVVPRFTEYQNCQSFPELTIENSGENTYGSEIEIACVITDSTNAVVYSHTVYYNQTIESNSTANVSFAAAWTPATTGLYHVNFTINNEDEVMGNNSIDRNVNVVYRVTTGGPDAFGYSWLDSNAEGGPEFQWQDISQTGASTVMSGVPTFSGDDNFSEPIPMGFDFPFYGVDYSQMYVDINGEILLADNIWNNEYPSNGWGSDGNMFNYMYPIPGYTQMPGLIAVFWDDLQADQGTGDVFFHTFGNAPDRYTIIQWNNIRFHAGNGGSPDLKFQAILYESGELLFQYLSTSTHQSGATVPHENGRSATVAIQNAGTDIGLTYLREIVQNNTYIGVEPAGNLLHDGLAIRIFNAEDTQAPVITHNSSGNTFSHNISIKAHLVDYSAIASCQIHYNVGGEWMIADNPLVSGLDYTFNLPDLPANTSLQYYFTASDVLNNASTLPLDAPESYFTFDILPMNGSQVLLAYSGSQDYQRIELPVYEGILQALNIPYDMYNWEEYPSYQIPPSYTAVLCYANSGSSGVKSDTLSVALMNFMEQGTNAIPKSVFMASDGWAYSQSGSSNSSPNKKLFNAYFRTYYAATGIGGGTNGLAGPDVFTYQNGSILCTTAAPIGTSGNEYSVYANSPDCIFSYESCPDWYADEVQYPEIGAVNAFAFEDGPVNGQSYLYHGVCATAVDLNIYKAFFMSYDFSQLTDDAQRLELIDDLMTWFGVFPTANNDHVERPAKTGLIGNYPNPFNPETTISYTLKSAAHSQISIYNIKGQLVRTLIDAPEQAGSHSVVWNGKNNSGKPVASGIYFIKMTADDSRSTRKIMLMK